MHQIKNALPVKRTAFSRGVPLLAAVVAAAVACSTDSTTSVAPGFLGGTSSNHEIGLVLNSVGKSLTLFQLGSPTTQEQIALGASSTITPVGFSVRGRRAAVPLGNAASMALINLETATIQRYFVFKSGNTTGSAFFDDTTIFVANTLANTVGRVTVGQASDSITNTVTVSPYPTAIVAAGSRIVVISGNLNVNTPFYSPFGNSIATAIDPKTMQVLGTVSLGATNSSDAALGPDGLVYVVNTTDYSDGSVTILNPATMQVQAPIGSMGPGPGAISIDANGLAYITSYSGATLVWDTKAKAFVRSTSNPVCAVSAVLKGCRGAFAATTNAAGNVYQAFYGDATHGLSPYVFVYKAGTFALTDSITAGTDPSAIVIRTF